MASKTDDSPNAKKIKPKTSSSSSSAHGETSSTTTTATAKAIPNYLKPTISSKGVEGGSSSGKKQPGKAQATVSRPARAAALDKHASSFKQAPKAPSPVSAKDKSLLRSRSANSRTTAPASPRAGGGKPHTPNKQWVMKKDVSSRPKADQPDQPDHVIAVQESQKEDEDHTEEATVQTEIPPVDVDEPVEHHNVEPEIKDVGEIIQNTNPEQIEETIETEDVIHESKDSPTSEVIDDEITEEKTLGKMESSQEVAPVNVEGEGSGKEQIESHPVNVEGEGSGKEQIESQPELKPRQEDAVRQKPTTTKPETEVVKKTAARGKDAPAYNDVIEETASKLAAEKRKNRVLALAGAFETVISLHEAEAQAPKDRE